MSDSRLVASHVRPVRVSRGPERPDRNTAVRTLRRNLPGSGPGGQGPSACSDRVRFRLQTGESALAESPAVPGAAGASVTVAACLQVTVECTFLDYIMGGCQLNFTVSSPRSPPRQPPPGGAVCGL